MLKQAKNSFLFMSVVYLILGLLLLLWPGKFLTWGCYALGIVVLLYGLSRIVSYMANKDLVSYLNADLVVGIIVAAIGLFLLLRPAVFISILPIVFGLFIIFNGIVKLQNAFDLKRMNYEKWWSIFILSGISVLLGLFIIWNPFEAAAATARMIGIVLIVEGISGFGSTVFSWHMIRKMTKLSGEDNQYAKTVSGTVIEEEEL